MSIISSGKVKERNNSRADGHKTRKSLERRSPLAVCSPHNKLRVIHATTTTTTTTKQQEHVWNRVSPRQHHCWKRNSSNHITVVPEQERSPRSIAVRRPAPTESKEVFGWADFPIVRQYMKAEELAPLGSQKPTCQKHWLNSSNTIIVTERLSNIRVQPPAPMEQSKDVFGWADFPLVQQMMVPISSLGSPRPYTRAFNNI